MEIRVYKNYQELSKAGAKEIFAYLEKKRKAVICVATGESPKGIYNLLTSRKELFSETVFLKLDEWGGIPPNDPSTCESYIKKFIITPLGLTDDRLLGFNTNPKKPDEECKRVLKLLDSLGGIDISILGLGSDGHIGLNFPAESIPESIHTVPGELLTHSMLQDAIHKPQYGFTLGFREILMSSKIILPVSGSSKREALKKFLRGELTTQNPASILRLSQNLIVLCDEEAYGSN